MSIIKNAILQEEQAQKAAKYDELVNKARERQLVEAGGLAALAQARSEAARRSVFNGPDGLFNLDTVPAMVGVEPEGLHKVGVRQAVEVPEVDGSELNALRALQATQFNRGEQ